MTDKRYPNAQAHCWSQLSASLVRTPPNILHPPSKQQPQIVTTKQKNKKSRGDRAEQHFQRRLRQRNLDEETRALLMQARVERKREQQQQETVLETAMEVNEIGNQMINMAQDKQMV
ncbi:unnamed protein product, partial [Rotaria sp. Silwood1]